MSSRPDQIRDKDSIQRDTISCKIVGPVRVSVEGLIGTNFKHYARLCLFEPPTSNNTENPKFAFTFASEAGMDALDAIQWFANDIIKEVERARKGQSE